MNQEFTQTFFLSAGETDAEGYISLPLLVSKIIDIATAHANSLGIGNPSMQGLGCGWVLSRLTLEMTSYPRVNGDYSITTWIETWNRRFSERCFMVCDSEGNPCGYARSVWMVLDTASRESVDLTILNLDPAMISTRECPIARGGRHRPILTPEEIAGAVEAPRGAIAATLPPEEYVFRYCDLDFYRHVNTVRYVSMLMNGFTLEEMDSTRVERLEMSFMHEGHYGEQVELLRAVDELQTDFSIRDLSTRQPLLYAVVRRCSRG